MDRFSKLDTQRRLTPWNDKEHAAYVSGKYGSLLASDKGAAEAYAQEYEMKEVQADAAYEGQRTALRTAPVSEGEKPQELPDQVKIEWNPRKLFKPTKVKETEKAEKEIEKAEELKKEEEKAAKKLEKDAAKEEVKLEKAKAAKADKKNA